MNKIQHNNFINIQMNLYNRPLCSLPPSQLMHLTSVPQHIYRASPGNSYLLIHIILFDFYIFLSISYNSNSIFPTQKRHRTFVFLKGQSMENHQGFRRKIRMKVGPETLERSTWPAEQRNATTDFIFTFS